MSTDLCPLRVGFVALADAAPLVMAHRLGFFKQHGLDVKLCLQASWSTLRDKLVFGELDAAQLLSPLWLALNHGLGGGLKKPMAPALVMSRGGNALVVSNRVFDAFQAAWDRGVPVSSVFSCGAAFKEGAASGSGHEPGMNEVLKVGTVFPSSLHSLQLQSWLAQHGLGECSPPRFEVVPPARMVRALKEGLLDVCCVGEPYGSLAELEQVGHIVAHSDEFWPEWPEKVLGVTQAKADELGSHREALYLAVQQACEWLEESEANRLHTAQCLAEADVLDLPVELLEYSLTQREGLCIRFGGSNEVNALSPLLESMQKLQSSRRII